MRSRLASLAGLTLLLVALAVPGYAGSIGGSLPGSGDPFILSFDENGNGFIDVNGTGFVGDTGLLLTDPMSGMRALAYLLPEPVVTGDVGIIEPGGGMSCSALTCSDGLRFEQIGNHFWMFYFSDPGGNSLADTGLPSDFNPADFAQENGPEGDNGFDYLPGGNDYRGKSDGSIPEIDPSSAMSALALLSGTLLVVRGRRK